jgi:hypothetical protein
MSVQPLLALVAFALFIPQVLNDPWNELVTSSAT